MAAHDGRCGEVSAIRRKMPTAYLKDPPIRIASVKTARLSRIWAAISRRGLVAVDFGISRAQFEADVSALTGRETMYAPSSLRSWLRQIDEYINGKRQRFDLSIDWSMLASDFQRLTLRAVFAIPYGQTRSYADIAAQIGRPRSARAVGRANATNPMPLVIPCHRVIGTDGRLHGYGGTGGLRTKAWLLRMESSAAVLTR
jgi:methylated-DNA-[protein]-cysteine S-methyltransferase